jgi:hypothetical protein
MSRYGPGISFETGTHTDPIAEISTVTATTSNPGPQSLTLFARQNFLLAHGPSCVDILRRLSHAFFP